MKKRIKQTKPQNRPVLPCEPGQPRERLGSVKRIANAATYDRQIKEILLGDPNAFSGRDADWHDPNAIAHRIACLWWTVNRARREHPERDTMTEPTLRDSENAALDAFVKAAGNHFLQCHASAEAYGRAELFRYVLVALRNWRPNDLARLAGAMQSVEAENSNQSEWQVDYEKLALREAIGRDGLNLTEYTKTRARKAAEMGLPAPLASAPSEERKQWEREVRRMAEDRFGSLYKKFSRWKKQWRL